MSSTPTRIVLGLAPLEEEAIEEELYGSGELRILGSGAEAGELLELAATSAPELVLVSAGLPGLDQGTVARLRALGPLVAGLALAEDDRSAIAALGLELIVSAPFEAKAVVALLSSSGVQAPSARPPAASRPRGAGPVPCGSALAVVGTKGAPGASELAASLAFLVSRVHRVLLVELDADGGTLASRLGVDAREGSLLGLARALAAGEPDPAELLPHWVGGGNRGWPEVLLGFPDPRSDLAEAAVPGLGPRLLEVLGETFPLLICDVGHRLLAAEGDPAARLHRELVCAADAAVVVLGARADQVEAGLRQLDLILGELGLRPEMLRVVVNGQPGVHPGAAPAELGHALAERALVVDAWLPHDRRGLRAALRRATPIAAAAPRGPYARALAALAEELLLPSLPRPAARKLRLRPRALGADWPGARADTAKEVALPWRRS